MGGFFGYQKMLVMVRQEKTVPMVLERLGLRESGKTEVSVSLGGTDYPQRAWNSSLPGM